MTNDDRLIELLARGLAADRAKVGWDEMPAEIQAMYRDEATLLVARLERYGLEVAVRSSS